MSMHIKDKEGTKKLLGKKAELLKTIAHPVRLCLLTMLMNEGSSNVTGIQCCLDVPQPTVSQHLSKLKSAGIVKAERRGTEINYSIADEDVRSILNIILK